LEEEEGKLGKKIGDHRKKRLLGRNWKDREQKTGK
jgi:hypothetical protein